MSMLSRREARENLLELLFETEFRSDESFEEIYAISAAERELPDDSYVKDGYFTICREREAIDGMIGRPHFPLDFAPWGVRNDVFAENSFQRVDQRGGGTEQEI